MRSYKVTLGLAAMSLLGASMSACSSTASTPDLGTTSDLRHVADMTVATPKAVYTLSNDVNDNQIVVYARAADGTLTQSNTYSTGGKGSGASLGSQNPLIFDAALNMFFAVNAGDYTVSMLSLKSDGTLTLLDNELSGGFKPVSVTEQNGYVYVLNAGNANKPGNIAGFQVVGSLLNPLSTPTKPLSSTSPGVNPAQIQFTPDGTALVVTEKTTNKIDTYTVSAGIATGPNAQPSLGTTPFGFAFSSSGKLIVTEAVTNTLTKGTASSYSLSAGAITTISNQVGSTQTSPCWITVSGNTAFVSNTGSNTISAYSVGTDGSISLLAGGMSATTGMSPSDIAVTPTNDFLYVLNSASDSLSIYTVGSTGTLTKKPTDFTNLPPNAAGLVAR